MRKTWTNIDTCCMAWLAFVVKDGNDTDAEVIRVVPAGPNQGKEMKFTDCTTCGRRWSIRPEKKGRR